MTKNIAIILKKHNIYLGKAGNVIQVKRGYALNYLIPNHIAEIASKGTVKHNQMLQRLKVDKIKATSIQANELKQKLENINKISIKKKTGTDQLIFGSINSKDIAEIIESKYKININKQNIKIPNIKQLGVYIIEIQILKDVKANLKLQIIPQDI